MIWEYSGLLRDIARRLAPVEEPVSLRHKIAAAFVLPGALCFALLIFGILYRIFPQVKNIFDIWYGGIAFCIGFIICLYIWVNGCMLLKKWYIALMLSLGIIAGYFFIFCWKLIGQV